jgi:hypothetical protein
VDDIFREDRWYGARYRATAGDDLYLVGGRILSDLKTDQAEGRLPASAVIVVAVAKDTITVRVHVQDVTDYERMGATATRAQVKRILERYNWTGKTNRRDVRYKDVVNVRTVQSRIETEDLGTLLG